MQEIISLVWVIAIRMELTRFLLLAIILLIFSFMIVSVFLNLG
ncbi:hypothetical protein LINPERHAP1_LOCUS30311 [Linum perenne]